MPIIKMGGRLRRIRKGLNGLGAIAFYISIRRTAREREYSRALSETRTAFGAGLESAGVQEEWEKFVEHLVKYRAWTPKYPDKNVRG